MFDHELLLKEWPIKLAEPPKQRRKYHSIFVDSDGRIQPLHRPQRIKAEGIRKGCKPPKRKPRRLQREGPIPTMCDRAIARYLAASPLPAIPDPVAVAAPVVRENRITESEPPAPGAKRREPLDALDLKALEWLKRKGLR